MNFIDNKKELDKYASVYASKTPPNSLKNLGFKRPGLKLGVENL